MAVPSPSSPETLDPKSDKPRNPNPNPNPTTPSQPEPANPSPTPSPSPNPNPNLVTPPPPPSTFRPVGASSMPQYPAAPTPSFIRPPGLSAPPAFMNQGATISAPPMRYPPPMAYGQPSNGYMPVAPPGIPVYPGAYPSMIRPGFPPRPLPPMVVTPQIPRPPIPGVRGFHPAFTPVVRPVVPSVAATEKPQTTVYVGKIAPTVDNDFLLSLLRLCGPVRSWKRAQDPSNGSPKGFGFCEFEAAEGILRALRLLAKLNIDGQELVLNINQATREYLERYIEKKIEREKNKESEDQALRKEDKGAADVEKQEPSKPVVEETTKDSDSSGDKKNLENQKFGIVTDEDREADMDALGKIKSMLEERLKTNPLPPPPPVPTPIDASAKSDLEVASKSRDGDSDVDIVRSDGVEDKNDDGTILATKPATVCDKLETSSPDRGRRQDRSSRERDRERDSKWEKEREMERYERERRRERERREMERETKIREAERLYNKRLKEWELREREKEYQRLKEKEREKDRLRERRREIAEDEDGSDDDEEDTRTRRRRSSILEERRRKRQREEEDDLADRLKEEEEIAEAKKRAIGEQKRTEEAKCLPSQMTEETGTVELQIDYMDAKAVPVQTCEAFSTNSNDTGKANAGNIIDGGEQTLETAVLPDVKQSNEAPARKLGFGLVGAGKKTSVPSVFHEDDDENAEEKKLRPLVPIDYSTEELQAVQSTVSSVPPSLVAAAEFAKRISSVNPKEVNEMDRDGSGRANDRVCRREQDRNDENSFYQNGNKEKRDKSHERERERVTEREREKERDNEAKPKSENKKLLDAKQLIDMIPKTKDKLFAYEINWDVYDKHALHEKMRPWISKKITEFLGEEEDTLVDYIVTSTKDHVRASKMLDLLQSILDDEAEMFVLKMWRMLIFEIKRVETGLSSKARA